MLKVPFRARVQRSLAAVVVLCAPAVFAQSADEAPQDDAGELPPWEWPDEVEGTLRTFFEREDVEAMLEGVTAPADAGVDTIEDLAAMVGGSAEQAFRY
ncbi:MAG: hypothetical protein GWO02_08160, partial [Gammaproteobacteria bacterium]|nr:hypothetical protein [Gammaproteobacteria bacterium]